MSDQSTGRNSDDQTETSRTSGTQERNDKEQEKKEKEKFDVEGDPPIVIGGGGSILIYSKRPLERLDANSAEIPSDNRPDPSKYGFVYAYEDRSKHPVRANHQRKLGGVYHSEGKTKDMVKSTDLIGIESMP